MTKLVQNFEINKSQNLHKVKKPKTYLTLILTQLHYFLINTLHKIKIHHFLKF